MADRFAVKRQGAAVAARRDDGAPPHRVREASGLTRLERYASAVLLAAAAYFFWRLGVQHVGLSPFFLYFVAVTVASWVGGRGPGLLAMLLGVIASSTAYTFPDYYVLDGPRGVLQLLVFLFTATAITLLQGERLDLLQRERALRRRSEQLVAEQTAMLEQMTEAVLIAGPDGRIVYLNDAAKRIFAAPDVTSYPPQQMGQWLRIFRPDGSEVPPAEFGLVRVAQGEVLTGVERVVERQDGSRVEFVANARQVRGPDGRVLGAIATVRDVSVERELERQQQGLLSTVVHDLKSPLATIKGLAQLSRRKVSRTPEIPEEVSEDLVTWLGDIDGKVSQMVGLINDIVEVGRRHDALDLREIDLLPTLRRLSDVIDRASDCHTIQLDTDLTSLSGVWDGSRLERVFENLLSNAVKYSPDGGVIHVSVHAECDGGSGEAVIAIRDPGIGIPAHDQARIFEQFYRAANAMQVASGTGVGLAAVKQTVERHGGTIELESAEGAGTTVRVRLPCRSNGHPPLPG